MMYEVGVIDGSSVETYSRFHTPILFPSLETSCVDILSLAQRFRSFLLSDLLVCEYCLSETLLLMARATLRARSLLPAGLLVDLSGHSWRPSIMVRLCPPCASSTTLSKM